VDGTQPETKVVVGLSSSATGQSGEGRISPRSSSLEAGPRRTCRPSVRSESADRARGPAQGVTEASDQGTAGLGDSHTVAETAPDEDQISTVISRLNLKKKISRATLISGGVNLQHDNDWNRVYR